MNRLLMILAWALAICLIIGLTISSIVIVAKERIDAAIEIVRKERP